MGRPFVHNIRGNHMCIGRLSNDLNRIESSNVHLCEGALVHTHSNVSIHFCYFFFLRRLEHTRTTETQTREISFTIQQYNFDFFLLPRITYVKIITLHSENTNANFTKFTLLTRYAFFSRSQWIFFLIVGRHRPH